MGRCVVAGRIQVSWRSARSIEGGGMTVLSAARGGLGCQRRYLNMLPGPDQIIACPHCKQLARYKTLRSGNTLGAVVWTDGKEVAPRLPCPPAVVECPHCGECYWVAEAEQVGTVDPCSTEGRQLDPAWAAAQEAQEPAEEGYYLALERRLAKDPQQERNLRILAWWRRNDAFRHARPAQTEAIDTASGAWRANLEALAALLNEADDSDRIMKAEVLRELGEFESAKELLKGVTSSEHGFVVYQIWSMCVRRDTLVRQVLAPA